MWLVRYTEPPCNTVGHYFCQDSGWGSEEATVVCREQGYSYGIGSECILHHAPGH